MQYRSHDRRERNLSPENDSLAHSRLVDVVLDVSNYSQPFSVSVHSLAGRESKIQFLMRVDRLIMRGYATRP